MERETLLKLVKIELLGMKEEERVVFFHDIAEGYCPHCGIDVDPGETCFCEDDS